MRQHPIIGHNYSIDREDDNMAKSNELTELQIMHQMELKEKREAVKKRKERTHRLIVRGAIAENAIEGSTEMTDEQFRETLLRVVSKGNAYLRADSVNGSGENQANAPTE